MEKRLVISVPQMFSMLFISRLVVEITYSGIMVKGETLWDHILSAVSSFFIIFLLILPIYFLFEADRSMDVLDNSYALIGKAGHLISGLYAIYFLFTCIHTLALFKIFLSNVINPPISTEVLLTTMVIAASYGAYKGVEGLARAAGIILFFMVISIFLIGISLLGNLDSLNFEPFLYTGNESFLSGTMFMISRSACIPAMAILLPLSKGKHRKGIFLWNLGTYSLIIISIILLVGSMGDFLKTQLFPVYTAASVAKIGALEHMDALYLGIWTMGIFIKLALFFMLSGECAKKVVGERTGKFFIFGFGLIMILFGVFLNKNAISSGFFESHILLFYMLIVGVVIPLALLIFRVFKNKNRIKLKRGN